jgi:type IV pilus assembly protein PilV
MTRRASRPLGNAMRPRSGFTVISMLVAVILLAVGLMSLARASAQTITMQTLAQNRTNAIAISRAYLEQIRTRDPWTVQSEPARVVDAEGMPAANGFYRRTVNVSVTRQNLLKVDVLVTYPRGTQPITLTTSFFRGNGLAGAR